MAALLKYCVAAIPAAVRVAISGGAIYGSAKYGVWTDSSESRERLDRLIQSTQRELEYPKKVFKYKKVRVCRVLIVM